MLMLCVVCIYYVRTSNYILYSEVIQSALICYIPKLIRKKYIPLPNLNFDDIVMSRGNRNFHLCIFVKCKALQYVTKDSHNHYAKTANDWGLHEFVMLTSLFDQDSRFLV
jgi:hypothetical protein